MRGLLKTKLGEVIKELQKSGASDEKIASEEKKYEVELGVNIGPITEFGKNYSRTQLYTLFNYVGKYCLGLSSFGPNILRSMHVTAVLIKAIDQGKKYDDPEIKDIFALARHGQYYREKTYNMVKADLDMARAKTFVHENYGMVGSIVGEGEKEGNLKFLEFFEGAGEQAFSGLSREQTNGSCPLSLQAFFRPGGVAGFMQQVSVALRGAMGATPMRVDNDPGYLADKKREEELDIELEREEIKLRIREREQRLVELRNPDSTPTVTGQKRPATATVVNVPIKKERLERSTDESDAVKLEILREMHALYVVKVEKRCILPSLKELTAGRKKKLFVHDDPDKVLKGKLRRSKPSILCVPVVGEFLEGFDPELCGKFDEAFGGKGDNVNALLGRVAKNKELPSFVWKDPVLSKCGDEECKYCE